MEFQRFRHELFRSYEPRTMEEADDVDSIVFCHWRIQRYRRFAAYCASIDCPDQADYAIAERRLERMAKRSHKMLLMIQKERLKGRIPGARGNLPDYTYFEREGKYANMKAVPTAQTEGAPERHRGPVRPHDPWSARTISDSPVEDHGKDSKEAGQARNALLQRVRPTVGHG